MRKREADAELRRFEIRIQGHLDPTWTEYLDGCRLRLLPNGQTLLTGHALDQSAFLGLINRLAAFNLTLLSVKAPLSPVPPQSDNSTGDKNGK